MIYCSVCGVSEDGKKKIEIQEDGKRKCIKCGSTFSKEGQVLDDGKIPAALNEKIKKS